jgi:hypothetical protein
MELLNEPGLEGNEDQVLFVLRKMQARIATERTLLSVEKTFSSLVVALSTASRFCFVPLYS